MLCLRGLSFLVLAREISTREIQISAPEIETPWRLTCMHRRDALGKTRPCVETLGAFWSLLCTLDFLCEREQSRLGRFQSPIPRLRSRAARCACIDAMLWVVVWGLGVRKGRRPLPLFSRSVEGPCSFFISVFGAARFYHIGKFPYLVTLPYWVIISKYRNLLNLVTGLQGRGILITRTTRTATMNVSMGTRRSKGKEKHQWTNIMI